MDAARSIQIIELANVPTNIFSPKKAKVLIVGFALAIILATGSCVALDYLDRTVKDTDEIEAVTQAPIFGFIPKKKVKIEEEPISLMNISLFFTEAFANIRTSLNLSLLGRSMKVCLVTSSVKGEGKTLTSFNMALSFARAGKKVLLLECDMRKPSLQRLLPEELTESFNDGLSSVLVGQVGLDDIIIPIKNVENLHIALCGHVPPNPSELLDSAKFTEIVEQAKKEYDMVIIDAPPILSVADTLIMAGRSIPVVFVVKSFATDKRQLQMAIEQLQKTKGEIVGVVVNNIEAKNDAYLSPYYYKGVYY